MEKSESISELGAALAKAQGEFESVAKSRRNPRFSHDYATLDDIISATRKALSANGLAIMQLTESEGINPYVVTLLAHSSGQWLSTRLPIMVGNIMSQAGKEVLTQAQAFGSALTYARRYALAALLNVAADDDDDAETAGEKGLGSIPERLKPDATKETAPGQQATLWCEEHGVAFKKHERGNQVWYSHIKPDGSWCNEGKLLRDFEDGAGAGVKAPGEGKDTTPAEKTAVRASQGQVESTAEKMAVRAFPEQALGRMLELAKETMGLETREALEKRIHRKLADMSEMEAASTIKWLERKISAPAPDIVSPPP